MILPFFSDLQAHDWSWTGMRENCLLAVQDFRSLCIKHGARYAVFGGDMFEAIGRVKMSVLDPTYEAVAKLAKTVHLFINEGNHGRGDVGSGHHVDTVFRDIPTTVVDTPSVFRIPDTDVRLTIVPYQGSGEALEKAVLSVAKRGRKKGDKNVLVIHDGVRGALVGPDEGYDPQEGVDPGNHMFRDFDIVMAGHYHRPQELVAGSTRVVFIGAPLQHKLGDRGSDPRGFVLLDTDTMTYTRVPLPYPTFLRAELSTQDDVTALLNQDLSRHYVEILIRNPDLDLQDLPRINAIEAITENDFDIATEDRLQIGPDDTIETIARGYVDLVGPQGDQNLEHRERLTRLGREIIERAGTEK